jgi:hypothetical protein
MASNGEYTQREKSADRLTNFVKWAHETGWDMRSTKTLTSCRKKRENRQAFNQITESVTEYTLAKPRMRFEKDRIRCNTYNLGE